MHALAEYIWMDGGSEDSSVQHLRSKTRVINIDLTAAPGVANIGMFPVWNFDGSSTNQGLTDASDQILQPVAFVNDPVRGGANFLVMCEVMTVDGEPHPSNTRAKLRGVLDAGAASYDSWFGFEQEYVLYEGRQPLGWPENGSPSRNQGPYYCGVGADEVSGRKVVEAHLNACMRAGILIYGINAEVMLGQWEYQIGHRGFTGETADPLTVSDHLWLSRWLLYRIGEDHGVSATLDCKPEKGDWNGSGAHTNFSTKAMRDQTTGKEAIVAAIAAMKPVHQAHITEYGSGLEQRLTGRHETCSINEFVAGESNRGASIRIPAHVNKQGYGYIEDRRPGANCDPYRVCARILKTICAGVPAAV